MPGSFFDSNVVLYLTSKDPKKTSRSEAILATGGTISVQVLNEIANVARRKIKMSWIETHDILDTVQTLLSVVPVTLETHELGLALAERYRLSVLDSMIAAAALLCGCETLWSEDMQHGQIIDGTLRVTNPFRSA